MKIISISGLDGSGKSTQINLLKTHFEDQGRKVFYFHAVQFSIANASKRIKNNSSQTPTESPSVTQASWLQIQLRKIAMIVDLFFFKRLLKDLKKDGYDLVLSDRYFYDGIVNMAYLGNKTVFSWLTSFIPRPSFAFYLKTSPELIMQRQRTPDQGLEYLQKKNILLDDFAKWQQLTIIDGNRTPEVISQDLLAQINFKK